MFLNNSHESSVVVGTQRIVNVIIGSRSSLSTGEIDVTQDDEDRGQCCRNEVRPVRYVFTTTSR